MGNFISHSNDSDINIQNQLLKKQNIELQKQVFNLREIIEKDRANLELIKKELLQKEEKSKKEKLERFYKNLDSSVDKYVDEMLKDEEINSVIPDYIEKKIYKNVFTIVLKLVRNITDSTSISFLDQELTFTLNQKDK